MAKKRNKKGIDLNEVLDIHQYALAEETSAALNIDAEPDRLVDVSSKQTTADSGSIADTSAKVKKILDTLILRDISDKSGTKTVTKKKKKPAYELIVAPQNTLQQKTGQTTKPSHYVVDLRKHFLIEKYNLDTLERPKRSRLSKIGLFGTKNRGEKIQWHIPEPIPQKKKSRPVLSEREDEQTEISYFFDPRVRTARILSFAAIMLFLTIPIPALHVLNGLMAEKNVLWLKALTAVSDLKASVADIAESQYATANERLRTAHQNFSDISTSLDQYNVIATQLASLAPFVKNKVVLAKNFALIGQHVSDVTSLLSQSFAAPDSSFHSDKVLQLQSHIAIIKTALENSQDEIRSLDPASFPPDWNDKIVFLKNNTDTFIGTLGYFNDLLTVAYHITGGEAMGRYLFVFQNSHELRPTGGFMGSFALVDFAKGAIQNMEFPGAGIYDLTAGFTKHLIPPTPISMLNKEWYIWDSNWWPDFLTSANKIAWFYQQSTGTSLDGVIAVNSDVMVDLLRLTGPIAMPEYGVEVSADNFYSVVEQEVEMNYDKKLNQPKKILKDLEPRILEKIFKTSNYQQLLAILTKSLYDKNIQTALFNTELERTVQSRGWGGQLRDTDKDYLTVVSTNVAGGKSDGSIYETIDHKANIDAAGRITVTTTVTKDHRAEPADPFAYVNNVGYMRFYVPLGSTLISAQGFQQPLQNLFKAPEGYQTVDPYFRDVSGNYTIDAATGTTIGRELDHTVFGNWMQVEPGQKNSVTLTYVLPFTISVSSANGVQWLNYWNNDYTEVAGYSLLVQSQSGAAHVILNSTVTIDPAFKVVWIDSLDPSKIGQSQQSVSYGMNLSNDTYYAFLLARANGTP